MIRDHELHSALERDAEASVGPEAAWPPAEPAVASQGPEEGGRAEMAHLVQRVFMSGEGASRQVLFCCVNERGGSTDVCARVGRLLAARSGKSVCLVDANRHPGSLSSLFGMHAATPAATRQPLAAKTRVDGELWLVAPDVSMGRPGGSAATTALKEQLVRLRGEFDYVLIDAPAILESEEAAMLGTITDGIILVIEAGATRRIAARKAKQTIEEAGVTLLGAVLHNRRFPIPEPIYRRI